MTTSSENKLKSYAVSSEQSLGRQYKELKNPQRDDFQRDRDRIIHANSFRRLMYKTQVFVNYEGDMYRTRLTHSLEVAQVGRSVAYNLQLNEALTEAVCLAHDLGHTPFGHAGQDALNTCMRDYGGFEHNLQSLRTVDYLEKRYAAFPGLNLMFETREGILKHCSKRNAKTLGKLGERFLKREQPCLEAQVADLSDAIAYNNHDVDDGLRAGLLTVKGLCETKLFAHQFEEVKILYPDLEGSLLHNEIIRRMINDLVSDLQKNSAEKIRALSPSSVQDVREAGQKMILMSDTMLIKHQELKKYLFKNFYKHPKVIEMNRHADKVITTLFNGYMQDLQRLPLKHCEYALSETELSADDQKARAVADYIAGMTDRFAEQEYLKFTV